MELEVELALGFVDDDPLHNQVDEVLLLGGLELVPDGVEDLVELYRQV